jgi:hypothetical protein
LNSSDIEDIVIESDIDAFNHSASNIDVGEDGNEGSFDKRYIHYFFPVLSFPANFSEPVLFAQ